MSGKYFWDKSFYRKRTYKGFRMAIIILCILVTIQTVILSACFVALLKYRKEIIEEWCAWNMFKADWQTKVEGEAIEDKGKKSKDKPYEDFMGV
jgi:hypothetical protein